MSPINSLAKQLINWPALMEQYEQGELGQKQFCSENNISVPQFKYYRKKLKHQPSSFQHKTALVPITIEAKPSEDNTMHNFQLVFENKIRCQIPNDFNPKSLKQLIEVLQAC